MTNRMGRTMAAALLAATVMVPMAAQASAAGQDSGWQGRQDGRGDDGRADPRGPDGRPANRQDRGQVQAGVQVQTQAQVGLPGYRGGQDDRRGGAGQPGGYGNPGGDPRGDGRQGGPGYGGDRDRDRGQGDGKRYDRGQYGGQQGRGGPGNQGYPGGQYGNGGYRDGQRGYGDARGGPNGGGWNSGWRQDRRYDWNGYRQQNRRAFGLPRYAAPYGWHGGYRRFSVGVSLNAALFGRSYWIQDPWAYRLPAAYGPYRWVRYYNDALLVDVRSGNVVDGVYGIFY